MVAKRRSVHNGFRKNISHFYNSVSNPHFPLVFTSKNRFDFTRKYKRICTYKIKFQHIVPRTVMFIKGVNWILPHYTPTLIRIICYATIVLTLNFHIFAPGCQDSWGWITGTMTRIRWHLLITVCCHIVTGNPRNCSYNGVYEMILHQSAINGASSCIQTCIACQLVPNYFDRSDFSA